MDDYGRINHILKVFGVILILLALTVFAQAAEHTFDCTDAFNCSTTSYCAAIAGAVPGLSVGNGGAGHPTLGEQPIEYSFTAYEGDYTCDISATVTSFYKQNQTYEKLNLYLNGISIGATTDNYCNDSSDTDCIFCGEDVQSLGTRVVELQNNNVLKIVAQDSHALVAVTLDCEPIGRTCENNITPIIDSIDDITLAYGEDFELDLFGYTHDADNYLSELTFDFNTSNDLLTCNLENNRYLQCDSSNALGTTTIILSAEDDCNDVGTTTFDVTITNTPPAVNVPDQEVSCAADLNQFINLHDYSFDEDLLLADYNIFAQTNTDLINCFVDENHFISCAIPSCTTGETEITIDITDIFGEVDRDTFKIEVVDYSPWWLSLPAPCLNENENEFIDLREYVSDLEDGNNLTFELTNQSDSDVIDCSIDNDYFISCTNISNQHSENILTLRAIDSKNNFAEEDLTVETNCFFDGNKRFEFSSEQKGVCLEECASYTTQITLKNDSTQRECFNFYESHRGYLRASIGNNSFCLNEGETTSFPLNISSCGADQDNYIITVEDEDQNIALEFDLEIGSCNNFDGFRIHEYEATICQGEEREFSVDVTNTSSKRRTIYLDADSTMLLPYFSKDKVILNSGEVETVQLNVNAKHADVGMYRILLGGDAINYHIEKYFLLDVKDCSQIHERNFIITAPQICYDVLRGQVFESSFSVRKLSDDCGFCSLDEKTIDLFLFGMPNELSYNTLTLIGSEERIVDYAIYVPRDATAGAQLLTITGEEREELPFDSEIGFVDDETICLNVQGESNSTISVRTQAKDIVWCGAEIFELEITNTGDFDETFNLSAINLPTGVGVSFSQNAVTVPKGFSEIVYVSISTSPTTPIVDNQFITVVLDGNTNIETKIYFNVKAGLSFEDIEILSSTEMISLKGNSEGQYNLQLRNNSERDYRNIKITFENIPTDVNIEEQIIPLLAKGQIISIEGKVIVGDINGFFIPSFVVETTTVHNKEPFSLYITKDPNAEFFGGLFGMGTGFFIFESGGFAFGVSVLLIVLVLIIILGLALTNSDEKEVWVIDNE